MKTPDEIKKGLVYCVEPYCPGEKCPYWNAESCAQDKTYDALAYIQWLESERDALIEELKNAHSCFACKRFRRNGGECCGGSVCLMRDFEWRGVQKEG